MQEITTKTIREIALESRTPPEIVKNSKLITAAAGAKPKVETA